MTTSATPRPGLGGRLPFRLGRVGLLASGGELCRLVEGVENVLPAVLCQRKERRIDPSRRWGGVMDQDQQDTAARLGAMRLFLPKYAPDLKPIEQRFATLKHCRRNAAERPRDARCRAIAQILDSISAAECANDLVNGGYARAVHAATA